MGNLRAVAATVLLAVGAGVLSGCSGSSQAASSPTKTVAPSAVPSAVKPSAPAGPTAPVMPAVVKEHSDRGAMAFAEFYMMTMRYGYLTGDDRLGPYTHPKCEGCQWVRSEMKKNPRPKPVEESPKGPSASQRLVHARMSDGTSEIWVYLHYTGANAKPELRGKDVVVTPVWTKSGWKLDSFGSDL